MIHRVEAEIGGKKLILETGRLARLADGAVLVTYGDSVVLVTAVAAKEAKKDIDFLPLTVDYQERAYAAGRIPGGFFKREGRLSEKETLTSRLIDRPMRPLFPDHWYFETQIIASVLSSDPSASTEILAIAGASAAVTISDIPFNGPIGAIRVGRIEGKFVAMPTLEALEKSDMNIVIAGTAEAVMMVESEIKELSEEVVLEAVQFGHKALQTVIALQKELQAKVGKAKRQAVTIEQDQALVQQVNQLAAPLREAVLIASKADRQKRLDEMLQQKLAEINTPEKDRTKEVKALFHDLERQEVREMILSKGIRADGRGPTDIRQITCEVGFLPRTHGSALFTRGETQALAVVTLGTSDDEQRIDSLEGESKKTFMLHYNFPPFSVGETRPMRGPGRREIGHGALAERSLKQVIPSKEAFPYTLRIVSDILESNGSSSMATVCGGTLALMDAGVPIARPVAGIAMGLVMEGSRFQVLSDILGMEDHLGDMDFKVTGTTQGITAFQLDIKIGGLNAEIMKRALEQAKQGRIHILDKMLQALAAPRPELSSYAPRIVTMKVKPDKVREVIGPGGKVIRGIIEKTGVKIDIDDYGVIHIASVDEEAAKKAIEMINMIVEEVEIGRVYVGKVTRIMDFGAIVELRRGVDGLVHISQLAHHRVKNVSDEVKEGDEVTVKVLEVDKQGKIRLSRKEALPAPAADPQQGKEPKEKQ